MIPFLAYNNRKRVTGDFMGKWKAKLAQLSGNNIELNRKSLQLKRSWDEVSKMLNTQEKKKKKK